MTHEQQTVPLKRLLSGVVRGRTVVARFDDDGVFPWWNPTALSPALTIGTPKRRVPLGAVHDGSFPLATAGSTVVAFIGKVGEAGLLTEDGVVNEQLVSLRPGPDTDPRYLAWLLKGLQDRLAGMAYHTVVAYLPLTTLLGVHVPRLGKAAQQRIADFLDAETARIDALIEKKRRMVELLDERWKGVLSGALLRGLWPMTRLKHVAHLHAGGTPKTDDPRNWADDQEDGIPWVLIGDMSRSAVVESTDRRLTVHGLREKRLSIGPPGTVLFAMYASVGQVARLGMAAAWNQAILGIVPQGNLSDERFIAYWLEMLQPTLPMFFRSNTQDNLNAEQVGNLEFPKIPSEQQSAVADALDFSRRTIDRARSQHVEHINLLRERRGALITAAVTGQSEIPGVAP